MARLYEAPTERKHKRPGGWGSPCPDQIGIDDARALLESAVREGAALYNVDGAFCLRAFRHDVDETGNELWHGHPIPWTRLPTTAKNGLVEAGRLTAAVYRKAIRQGWGREFSS